MRVLALLVALSGCNQVFGLDDTRLVDASHPFFDAPPQPPPGCPATGTPLEFSPGLTQAVPQDCRYYMPSFTPHSAIAQCKTDTGEEFYEGLVDGGMLPIDLDISCAAPNRCDQLRTVPEGSDAFLAWFDNSITANRLDRLHRGPDGKWRLVGPFTTPFTGSFAPDNWSQPTRGPERHMIAIVYVNPPVREFVATEPYETWTQVAQYSFSELGVANFFAPRLTADGLHLVFNGYDGMTSRPMIADRAAITDRFRPAVPILGVPGDVQDAVLSDDCDHLYFYGLESIFYQKRAR